MRTYRNSLLTGKSGRVLAILRHYCYVLYVLMYVLLLGVAHALAHLPVLECCWLPQETRDVGKHMSVGKSIYTDTRVHEQAQVGRSEVD